MTEVNQNAKPQATAAIVDIKLFQEVSKYLATRPYNEVAGLLTALAQNSQPVTNQELEILMNAKRPSNDDTSQVSKADLKVMKDEAAKAKDAGIKHV